jgi:LL-diaminopimelate aminotransferase
MNSYHQADRLNGLPFYLYPTMEKLVENYDSSDKRLIDLSIGEPDLLPPDHLIEHLCKESRNPSAHRYGVPMGCPTLLQAVATWYQNRFAVHLDPSSEVVPFIGSKEGIAFLNMAVLNQGDTVLIPDPAYPTYRHAASFAGAKCESFNLEPSKSYVADFGDIPGTLADKVKLLYLNYPNNPTGATVDKEFFEEAVAFAKRHGLIICHDAAYSEITFDGYQAPSLMGADGAKDVGIEFHTLSKTFSIPGWRIGFAVGNRKILQSLKEIKRVISSGYFKPFEMAAAEALKNIPLDLNANNQVIQNRRDTAINILRDFGINIDFPRGGIYIWVPIPKAQESLSFVSETISKAGVVTFPGIGYGKNGEGFIRIALVQELDLIVEGLKRLEPYLKHISRKL